ncbi:hypothetical protein BV22DRAFT_284883 [Leucogyrophana mollusca]|uniref:Uncharacterized protein n=1 Tax=Leucogyrophana mollusca TaxID=85980 RepID=A0ACB8BPH9_9AGAM|nr:hypothetical protein BV22DRAFT_284883 [Leucogyrophana mollusca]
MAERSIGRAWTASEDEMLSQAVAIHGEIDNWKAVATCVPGRTNKACRKRWLHSLSPNIKKSAWTIEEDTILLALYQQHNTKWSIIARNIPGRTDDACSKRYREALDPSLKRDEWTPAEDERLMESYSRLGGRWGIVGQELQRSGLACRNRWRLLERKRTTLPSVSPPSLSSSPTLAYSPYQDPSWMLDHGQGQSQFCHWDESQLPHFDSSQPPSHAQMQDFSPTFHYSSSSLSSALSPPPCQQQQPQQPRNEYQQSPVDVRCQNQNLPLNGSIYGLHFDYGLAGNHSANADPHHRDTCFNADSHAVAVYEDRIKHLDGLQRSVPHTRISTPVHSTLVHGSAPPAASEEYYSTQRQEHMHAAPQQQQKVTSSQHQEPLRSQQCGINASQQLDGHGADAAYYQALTPHAEYVPCGWGSDQLLRYEHEQALARGYEQPIRHHREQSISHMHGQGYYVAAAQTQQMDRPAPQHKEHDHYGSQPLHASLPSHVSQTSPNSSPSSTECYSSLPPPQHPSSTPVPFSEPAPIPFSEPDINSNSGYMPPPPSRTPAPAQPQPSHHQPQPHPQHQPQSQPVSVTSMYAHEQRSRHSVTPSIYARESVLPQVIGKPSPFPTRGPTPPAFNREPSMFSKRDFGGRDSEPSAFGSRDSAAFGTQPSDPNDALNRFRTSESLFGPAATSKVRARPTFPRKKPDVQAPLRLSSDLPATSDASIKPYACGHPSCWPSEASVSAACYCTSRGLSDHNKTIHPEDSGGDRPYRCGLEGCGKSWKSINGLQYHLQISKAHFQHAITNSFQVSYIGGLSVPPSVQASVSSNSSSSSPPSGSSSSSGSTSNTSDGGDVEKGKKQYSCPHDNCFNKYKQLSGLRYHLAHGHPPELPAQLDLVPPALTRKLTEKMRAQQAAAAPPTASQQLPVISEARQTQNMVQALS